jgi:hypothetical protein
MVSEVAGRVVFTIPPQDTIVERFEGKLDTEETADVSTAKASLIYMWFVTPPPEAKDRMQKSIIKRIESSPPEIKDKILNEEIPARMAGMNTLETTNPPVVMATAHITPSLK